MGFSILHLSDIHITSEEDTIFKYLDDLKKACACKIPAKNHLFIVISGDIANKGKEEEYQVSTKFIKNIEEYIQKEKNCEIDYIFVPGNHDCNFEYSNTIRDSLIQNINNDTDETIYESVTSVQKDYFNFVNNFYEIDKHLVSIKEFVINGKKIAFLLINSSWMSSIVEKPNTITIPSKLFKPIENRNYDYIFTVVHHPSSWLDQNNKAEYINYIKEKTDILFVGHEHIKEEYEMINENWSFAVYRGKELQNKEQFDSGFNVFNFNDDGNYNAYYFNLDNNKKERFFRCLDEKEIKFEKNNSIYKSVFEPNIKTKDFMIDTGMPITHTAKEEVKLTDIYVWPEIVKIDFNASIKTKEKISEGIYESLIKSNITAIVGASSSGKTSLAKMIFNKYINEDICCLYIDGKNIGNTNNYEKIVKNTYADQYNDRLYERFETLEKKNKVVLIDNVDKIQNREVQNGFLKYLIDNFEKVIVFSQTVMNIPLFLTSIAVDDEINVNVYEIQPFGNTKRHDFILRWYDLDDRYSNENLITKVQNSEAIINNFIGGSNKFISAFPINIIVALQTIDTKNNIEQDKSQIGFMYDKLINDRIIAALGDEYSNDLHTVFIAVLSRVACHILKYGKTSIEKKDIINIIDIYKKDKELDLDDGFIINTCINANLISCQDDDTNYYRFKYPYVYYYFAGRYLTKNYKNPEVKSAITNMCKKLYIEDYGNIILFATHFSDDETIVDEVLVNACCTLENYNCFTFDKNNEILTEIKKIASDLTIKAIGTNEDIDRNNKERLLQMDNLGINNGIANNEYGTKIEENENYKEINELFAALKIIEVLGQILRNYSGDLDGKKKKEIIREVYELGMKCIELIITNTGYIEEESVQILVENIKKQDSKATDLMAITKANKVLSKLIVLATRGMVENVARAMNNKLLETAIEKTLNGGTISERLVLIENKALSSKQMNVEKVLSFKKDLDKSNNTFALLILKLIVQSFLKYNKYDLRSRNILCSAFDFDTKIIDNKKTYIQTK